MQPSLREAIEDYRKKNIYPFHMPGHKRNRALLPPLSAWETDFTELDPLDNLHAPKGVLRRMEARAARLFGSEEALLQVNGSTGAILAAFSAACPPGSTVLTDRGAHLSAFHAMELRRLTPCFLFPPPGEISGVSGSISPDAVEKAFDACRENGIRPAAVFVTSPTYEGVLSDIAGIAAAARRRGVPLIVDEAHGAHLGFHPYFPESANRLGADVVIQSLHKTLPALTQTALLHAGGQRIDREKFRHFSRVYQTSSPSYVLLQSIDTCLSLLEEKAPALFAAYADRVKTCRGRLRQLESIRLLEKEEAFFATDPGKLLFRFPFPRADARKAAAFLRERYALEAEYATPEKLLFMTSVADTEAAFQTLAEAMEALDQTLAKEAPRATTEDGRPEPVWANPADAAAMGFAEAMQQPRSRVPIKDAQNKICADYVGCYPPGIPFLLPGELLKKEKLAVLQRWLAEGRTLFGIGEDASVYCVS